MELLCVRRARWISKRKAKVGFVFFRSVGNYRLKGESVSNRKTLSTERRLEKLRENKLLRIVRVGRSRETPLTFLSSE